MKNSIIWITCYIVFIASTATAQHRRYTISAGLNGGLHNADYAGSNQKYIIPFTTPHPYNLEVQTEWKYRLNKTFSFGAGLACQFSSTTYYFKYQTLFFPIEEYVFHYYFSTFSVGPSAALHINTSKRFSLGLHFGIDNILWYNKTTSYNFGPREDAEEFAEESYNNGLLFELSLNYAFVTSRNHDFSIQVLGMYRTKQLCTWCIPHTREKEEYIPFIFSMGIHYSYKYGKRL